MAQERVRTYIPELDSGMMGGIPQGHVVLVAGSAGTMKSSLCFNVLFNEAVNFKKVGIYLSLEQSSASLITHAKSLGFDMTKLNVIVIDDLAKLKTDLMKAAEKKMGTIVFVDLGTIRKQIKDVATSQNAGWLNVTKNIIKRVKEITGVDLLVLDSLSALYVLNKFDNPRLDLFFIFEFFRDEGLTTLLISEMRTEDGQYSEFGVEEFCTFDPA